MIWFFMTAALLYLGVSIVSFHRSAYKFGVVYIICGIANTALVVAERRLSQ